MLSQLSLSFARNCPVTHSIPSYLPSYLLDSLSNLNVLLYCLNLLQGDYITFIIRGKVFFEERDSIR